MASPLLVLRCGLIRNNPISSLNIVMRRSPAWLTAAVHIENNTKAIAQIHSGETSYVQMQVWQNMPTLLINDAIVYQSAKPFLFDVHVLLNDLLPPQPHNFYKFHVTNYLSNKPQRFE